DLVRFALGAESLDCSAAEYSEAFATSISGTVELSDADGLRTVVACLQDPAGNLGRASAVVLLDRQGPGGAFTLAGGATHTPTRNVQVTFTDVALDGVEVALGETPLVSCATVPPAAWQPYQPALPFT